MNFAACSISISAFIRKFRSPNMTLISCDCQLYCSMFVPLSLINEFLIICSNCCFRYNSCASPTPLSKWEQANVMVEFLYFNLIDNAPLFAIFAYPSFIYEAAISLMNGLRHRLTYIMMNSPTSYSDLIFTYLSFSEKNSV